MIYETNVLKANIEKLICLFPLFGKNWQRKENIIFFNSIQTQYLFLQKQTKLKIDFRKIIRIIQEMKIHSEKKITLIVQRKLAVEIKNKYWIIHSC